ncbi:hypothetical protein J3459_016145 [Metarhizium acridum]|nr:hypothetical protein J3459_016145 [Metarhizium acridum]
MWQSSPCLRTIRSFYFSLLSHGRTWINQLPAQPPTFLYPFPRHYSMRMQTRKQNPSCFVAFRTCSGIKTCAKLYLAQGSAKPDTAIYGVVCGYLECLQLPLPREVRDEIMSLVLRIEARPACLTGGDSSKQSCISARFRMRFWTNKAFSVPSVVDEAVALCQLVNRQLCHETTDAVRREFR